MLTLLLTLGRELLLLKSCCASPCQEFSQLRELSISLFRDLMKTVRGNNKRRMKTNARMGLLPLFLRMSDQTQSVAKVQLSKLSSGAGKRAPAAWARARPSFLRVGLAQEQSQEWGTPSLLPRPWCHLSSSAALQASGEALLAARSSSGGSSSSAWCGPSRRGGSASAW